MMAQQMVNGSRYNGSVTETNRMSKDYAVVNPLFEGKHKKPQDSATLRKRKLRWEYRKIGLHPDAINRIFRGR